LTVLPPSSPAARQASTMLRVSAAAARRLLMPAARSATGIATRVPAALRIPQSAFSTALLTRPLAHRHAAGALAAAATGRRSLFIRTDTTPNPNSLKFTPGVPVLPEEYGNSKDFKSFESTNVSPLARRLFKVEGVSNVYLTREYVAVTRATEDLDWEDLKLEVYTAIMDFYASGAPVVTDQPQVSDTTILDDDSEVS
jgi:hypothetical protein